MKYDIILSGVGGQGIISSAAIITGSAVKEGLFVKQVDVHGMAQRGGMVVSHLRLSKKEIASDQIPMGAAQMILSTEPMESLRYLDYLSPDKGILITSREPIKNISNYPDIEKLLNHIENLPKSILVDAETIARKVGSHHTVNMVMLGAASVFLPLHHETLRKMIVERFTNKENAFVELNLRAFDLGKEYAVRVTEKSSILLTK